MGAPINGLLLLAAILAVLVGVTVLLALTWGRRLARRSKVVAVVACGLAVPIVIVAFAWLQYAATRNAPGDGPAMGLAGLLIIAALASPATVMAAWLALRRTGDVVGRSR